MRSEPGEPKPCRSASRLDALAILHPFPSILNAALVAAIVLISGGSATAAATLAGAMVTIQFSIGVTNDLADEPADRSGRPHKPLVRGDIRRGTAMALAIALGTGGLGLAASWGPIELALLAAMYGCGLAYDLGLKRRGLGWLAYAVAFPLLPAYAWFGATGEWPPRYEVLLPLAALAGPALAIANGLVDHDRDTAAGERTLVVRLGRRRALLIMATLLLVIHVAASLTLAPASVLTLVSIGGSALLAALGVVFSRGAAAPTRERGWQLQAVSIALLATAWFTAAVLQGRPSG